MIIKYFKQFFEYFKEERRPFVLYALLSVIAAIMELMGVALIYPFVLKILSGERTAHFETSPIVIGLFIILIFLLKNLFMIAYTYIQTRYTNNFGMKLQRRIMRYYLGASFQETSKISLAQKSRIMWILIPNIMNGFIFRLLNLSVNFFIFCLISACLAIKFPMATMYALLFGVIIICCQTRIYRPFIDKVSKKISESSLKFNQASNDALLNIKAVKISNNEKYFYDNYKEYMKMYLESSKNSNFLSAIPPYVTEPFAIILLFVLVAVITAQTYAQPEKLIASLALVGVAIFRLTPAISRLQVNLNGLNSSLPFVTEFLDIYKSMGISSVPEIKQKDFIKFNQYIELKNISFGYSKDRQILKDFNLKINKGEFIGVTGESGAGKTTLVDIIAGLYKPDSGEILIDGHLQDKPIKIGYVPQEFILIKGSIRDNVAFGNPVADDEKIISALKKAQLYEFVENNFKSGIYAEPFVDSLGLSQGQKQRLAIARALYTEPDLLILDEATSALDMKTEEEVCSVLNNLKGKMTIIVIAHRPSAIKFADRIIKI